MFRWYNHYTFELSCSAVGHGFHSRIATIAPCTGRCSVKQDFAENPTYRDMRALRFRALLRDNTESYTSVMTNHPCLVYNKMVVPAGRRVVSPHKSFQVPRPIVLVPLGSADLQHLHLHQTNMLRGVGNFVKKFVYRCYYPLKIS